MKQALRVAFGFLILWASVLHAEVRIVIDSGVDSGPSYWCCSFPVGGAWCGT
ncbi:translocation protein TolB [Escherichia coli]|uniref:Translocation protein TolB n=1 Tax=Escherichia coli TaxID=562 RepID=A0A2X3K1A9_ECOLX|nr:translocation protein TolB [Escherichia coli]